MLGSVEIVRLGCSQLNRLLSLALLTVAATASAGHFKLYVLTGQSNSLGPPKGTEPAQLPRTEPADPQVKFWWENWAGAGIPIGNSTNHIPPLLVQQGGY